MTNPNWEGEGETMRHQLVAQTAGGISLSSDPQLRQRQIKELLARYTQLQIDGWPLLLELQSEVVGKYQVWLKGQPVSPEPDAYYPTKELALYHAAKLEVDNPALGKLEV